MAACSSRSSGVLRSKPSCEREAADAGTLSTCPRYGDFDRGFLVRADQATSSSVSRRRGLDGPDGLWCVTDFPSAEAGAYPRLQSLLLGVQDLASFLTDLAELAAETVAEPASCGITVRYDGHLLTVGSSDARAELLDETQYRLGGGPCVQSLETGELIDSPDTLAEERWPTYIAQARQDGLRCSLSLPLTVGEITFGAVNVYGFDRPHLFGPAERRQLELFTAQAAGTLRLATRHVRDGELLRQMEEALHSRTVIDQAMGIIMAQQHCTADDAFRLLRRQSQNSRRRLRDIAGDLVRQITGEEAQPGRPFDAERRPDDG